MDVRCASLAVMPSVGDNMFNGMTDSIYSSAPLNSRGNTLIAPPACASPIDEVLYMGVTENTRVYIHGSHEDLCAYNVRDIKLTQNPLLLVVVWHMIIPGTAELHIPIKTLMYEYAEARKNLLRRGAYMDNGGSFSIEKPIVQKETKPQEASFDLTKMFNNALTYWGNHPQYVLIPIIVLGILLIISTL